jgi:hypothetical protein
MTDDYNARAYRQALGIVDALLTPARADTGARAPGDGDAEQRARVADLRHVRTMLYTGRGCQQVVDQLAPLCPCGHGPEDYDGPQQDCPIHGDGSTFVDLCRWRDRVVGGAHALLGALDTNRPDVVTDVPAVNRLRELLDAGPWAGPMPDGPDPDGQPG